MAVRTVTGAQGVGAVREAAWASVVDAPERRMLSPKGLYRRREMTALMRHTTDHGRVPKIDRPDMRTLVLRGIRRNEGARITILARGGIRAGNRLNRGFTAPQPDHWVTDLTYCYCRTWTGWLSDVS